MILPTMKTFIISLFATTAFAASPMIDFSQDQKIAVQNTILAQVNGTTISMIDVKKKMDMLLYQNYPQFADSNLARYQFYEASWKRVLMDLVDHELIISDAQDKEVKVTDGEIREVMEERFGPGVMQTLDKIGLTYEETWKMVKNELLAHRMNWWFVNSKAISSVTPQDIRQAYRLYLKENPAYSQWKYRVVTIRVDKPDDMLSERVYRTLQKSGKTPDTLQEELKQFEAPGVKISVSNEFSAKTQDLSEIHKNSLATLHPGIYGKPSFQMSRADRKTVYRIFYLIDKTDFPAPTFEELSNHLRNELTQKATAEETGVYLNKLRKRYGFDADKIIPEDLHPFSLQ
ncbi:MAG: hypothetical protein COT85_04850 [Chlamydiae bacterium CG10_big_fil_rev_8_21_14_0_10_42_34]|nr:MAG: hypothetical protein COT85_04850 [Chlamydiae bacterium CG10_big_fil_rev_8_21_14_0_10_42_34]